MSQAFSLILYVIIVVSQKTATAVAHCKRGNGLIKVNGRPLEMVEPATLQYKVSWDNLPDSTLE